MKFKDFQAPVLFSSTFKALNLGEKNSRTFKYFQGCMGTLMAECNQLTRKLQPSSETEMCILLARYKSCNNNNNNNCIRRRIGTPKKSQVGRTALRTALTYRGICMGRGPTSPVFWWTAKLALAFQMLKCRSTADTLEVCSSDII